MREPTKQVNWRLPESLVEELKEVVAASDGETLTDIVREGIQQKVARKKRQIERRRREAEVAA